MTRAQYLLEQMDELQMTEKWGRRLAKAGAVAAGAVAGHHAALAAWRHPATQPYAHALQRHVLKGAEHAMTHGANIARGAGRIIKHGAEYVGLG